MMLEIKEFEKSIAATAKRVEKTIEMHQNIHTLNDYYCGNLAKDILQHRVEKDNLRNNEECLVDNIITLGTYGLSKLLGTDYDVQKDLKESIGDQKRHQTRYDNYAAAVFMVEQLSLQDKYCLLDMLRKKPLFEVIDFVRHSKIQLR